MLEPEGYADEDEGQDATRPALADEAKKALAQAEARRRALSPIVEKDAPTAAMNPNEYHNALAQLQRQRQAGASAPAPPPSSRPGTRQESRPPTTSPSVAPRSSPQPTPSGLNPRTITQTGPNRPLSVKELASEVPSARDLASSVRRSMPSIPPPTNTGPPPPLLNVDDPNVINALLGNSASGPPPPLHTPTGPSMLGLKAGGGNPLAPQRTPLPLAVVGGAGGLRVATDRPGSIPPPNSGATPKTTPSAQSHSRPPGAMGSRPPGAQGPPMGSRPPGATGPKQYDFARWSSPEISEMPSDGAPVTFQVYTAKDVASGRGPMRSMASFDPPEKKSSLGLKIGLAVVGAIVVLITAAAVIMVSTDDQPKKDPSVAPSASVSVGTAPETPPPPTSIVISDTTPGVLPEEPAPSAVPTTKPPRGKKPKPEAAPAPIAEPSVIPAPKSGAKEKDLTPPNPYGTPGK